VIFKEFLKVDKVKEKEIILEYEEGKAHSQRSVLVDRNLSHRNNATSQNPARNIFWR